MIQLDAVDKIAFRIELIDPHGRRVLIEVLHAIREWIDGLIDPVIKQVLWKEVVTDQERAGDIVKGISTRDSERMTLSACIVDRRYGTRRERRSLTQDG
jgi:hypothetical protein